MIAVERGRRVGYMEGQSEHKNMKYGKNFQAPTRSRLTKQQWHLRVEDVLYFHHNVPSHLLADLVKIAFERWGSSDDPVTTARKIMDCYVGRSRRDAVEEDQRRIQAAGEEARRVREEQETVRETAPQGHVQEEGGKDRQLETPPGK